jgi:proline iminopeptidase
MAIIQEGYIQATGGKVWYKETGIGKDGIPLLVLHGWPGAAHDYMEPVEPLSDE